jgi:MFS family permease
MATVGAIVSNIIAGFVIKQPILEDWRKLFILFSIVYFIGGVVYLLYGSAVPRKWATFKSQKSEEKTNDDQGEAMTMLERHTDVPLITKDTDTNQTKHLPE